VLYTVSRKRDGSAVHREGERTAVLYTGREVPTIPSGGYRSSYHTCSWDIT